MNDRTLLDLEIGTIPRVVATVCSYETLLGPWLPEETPCDVVEVRLDQFESRNNNWLTLCSGLEAAGMPVILTPRSQAEGGKWDGTESERAGLLSAALDVLSTVDVEWLSDIKEALCRQGAALGKSVIVSHHNFDETPELPYLRDVVDGIAALGNTIPKISTFVNGPRDIDTLQELLDIYSGILPICIIGMGPLGTKTRVMFPMSGSALTYGYLGRASAPGQLPAQDLFEKLRALDPAYNANVVSRKRIPLPAAGKS